MSPYLFAMSMDVLACVIKDISPWCMIFADDIVLRSTRRDEVKKKLRQGAEYQQKENCIQDVQWTSELGWELRYQSTRR